MSVKMSANRFPLDSLTVLSSRTATTSTITSTAASDNFIPIDVLTSYWATGDIAENLDMAVVIEVAATAGTAPTFSAAVQVAPDSGAFSAPVATDTLAITGAGRYVMIVDRDDLYTALGTATTAASLRLYLTLGGTSPSITYLAYVSPLTGV